MRKYVITVFALSLAVAGALAAWEFFPSPFSNQLTTHVQYKICKENGCRWVNQMRYTYTINSTSRQVTRVNTVDNSNPVRLTACRIIDRLNWECDHPYFQQALKIIDGKYTPLNSYERSQYKTLWWLNELRRLW